MPTVTETVDFKEAEQPLQGLFACDDSTAEARPGILVCHTWAGQGDFEDDKAKALAGLGYAALAGDVFGRGRRGSSPEENQALLDEMVGDRSLLLRRLSANIDYLCSRPEVDASRIAAIGFCFGGLCVLDIARGGLDVAGVVSFHGLLGSPGEGPQGSIAAKVLALHGWDDPLAPPDAVTAFAAEMSARDADWQLHAYGGTAHAFTNPAAQDPENGMQYQPVVTERAWTSMQNFLAELFSA